MQFRFRRTFADPLGVRLAFSLLAVALALIFLPAPRAQAGLVTPFIVGGSTVSSATELPYQAQVIIRPPGAGYYYLCGGSLIAPDLVATAAHCLQDDNGAQYAASTFTVTVGQLNLPASGGQTRGVARAIPHPSFTGAPSYRYDAAMLQLASPVTLGSTVALLPVGPANESLPTSTNLQVSGWGTTAAVPANASPSYNYGPSSPTLRKVTVPISTACAAHSGYQDPDTQLCAGTTSKDACEGDSGGPLTSPAGGVHLVGIVSSGNGCASTYPGIYTRVGKDSIRAFLLAPLAPLNLSAPAVQGSAVVGQTVSCATGSWAGATALDQRFLVSGREVVPFGGTSYLLTAADLGQTVTCQVRGSSAGGTATADSPAIGPVVPAPVAAPPVTPPAVQPITPVITAPATSVRSASCKKGICVVNVTVASTAPGTVAISLRAKAETRKRTHCGSGKRRRACTRTVIRTLVVKRRTARTFRITTTRLEPGKVTFRLVATDAQGRRQPKATTLVRLTHR